jgi:hypothetical protein
MRTLAKFLMITVALASEANLCIAADAVSINRIDGLDTLTNGLMANTQIRFYLNYEVGSSAILGIENAYRFYSTNGATWLPISAQYEAMFLTFFDNFAFLELGVTGSGADTLALFAFAMGTTGLPAGFDSNLFFIETSFSEEQIGKTVCLDTTSRPGYDPFSWVNSELQQFIPQWEGPYCLEIVDCCLGVRGDVNGDGTGPNVIDLTRLVDHVYRDGPSPTCKPESDINSDGISHNVEDLTFVVDRIFRGGPPPGNCPLD